MWLFLHACRFISHNVASHNCNIISYTFDFIFHNSFLILATSYFSSCNWLYFSWNTNMCIYILQFDFTSHKCDSISQNLDCLIIDTSQKSTLLKVWDTLHDFWLWKRFLWSWLLIGGPVLYSERGSKTAVVMVLWPKITYYNFAIVPEIQHDHCTVCVCCYDPCLPTSQ